jgi:hypothetical protein
VAGVDVRLAIVTQVTEANWAEICSTLGNNRFFDIDVFAFSGVKDKNVTITP